MMFEAFYARMCNILREKLNIPVQKVTIDISPYNQKSTDECVVFSLQNKMDLCDRSLPSSESASELSSRLRAEQAILAYLLTGVLQIPHADEQECVEYQYNYPADEWYGNYPEVCQYLDMAIANLEFSELSKLYLAIEMDGLLSLSSIFKSMLLQHMLSKVSQEDYIETPSWLPEHEAEEEQALMAPQILYRKSTHTFFCSRLANLSAMQEHSPSSSSSDSVIFR